jgi:hypothetical protein
LQVNIIPQLFTDDTRAYLERPAPDLDIFVHSIEMDFVDASNNETLPLDTLYLHHYFLFTSASPQNASEAALARPDSGMCQRSPEMCADYATRYSLNIHPCAVEKKQATLAFLGGAADLRGTNKRTEYEKLRWAEPAGTVRPRPTLQQAQRERHLFSSI